jgi:hypothetical protein
MKELGKSDTSEAQKFDAVMRKILSVSKKERILCVGILRMSWAFLRLRFAEEAVQSI